MGIFQVIRSSFYDPAFYAGMRNRTWGEGAKYYAVIAFIIVFAYIVPVWTLLLQVKPEMVDTFTNMYPDNLEVTLGNGELHTNQPEPFVIPNTLSKDFELPENIAVFDTQNDDFSPHALADAKTLVLFKKTFVLTANMEKRYGVAGDGAGESSLGQGEQRVIPYATSTATSTLTKAMINDVAAKVKPYVRPVAIIGGAFAFVLTVLLGGLGMLVFHLIYVLFPALLVFVYFKLRKQDETYRTAYVTALFASIPVSILFALVGLFGTTPVFTYTLVLLIVIIVNLTQYKPVTPASVPQA
jgi:hypothetical protein